MNTTLQNMVVFQDLQDVQTSNASQVVSTSFADPLSLVHEIVEIHVKELNQHF